MSMYRTRTCSVTSRETAYFPSIDRACLSLSSTTVVVITGFNVSRDCSAVNADEGFHDAMNLMKHRHQRLAHFRLEARREKCALDREHEPAARLPPRRPPVDPPHP